MANWAREIKFYFDGTKTIEEQMVQYRTSGREKDASKLEVARQIMQKNIARDMLIGKRV